MASASALDCDTAEIQDAADRFRLERGLVTNEQTIAWLSGRGLNVNSWKELLRTALLEKKLLQSNAIAAAAKVRFERSPELYAKANVGKLTVEDEGIAREIHLLLIEEGYSFDVLARRYSIEFVDTERTHPPSRRAVWRFQMPVAIADIAFRADFRGPWDPEPVQVGAAWQVYRIYNVQEPVFDDETENLLRSCCLNDALQAHQIAAMGALLEELGCERPSDLERLVVADDDPWTQRAG